jgi:hypothetical protein
MTKPEAKALVKEVLRDLRYTYGDPMEERSAAGALSLHMRGALTDSAILSLLLRQAAAEFAPAQAFVRSVLTELEKTDWKDRTYTISVPNDLRHLRAVEDALLSLHGTTGSIHPACGASQAEATSVARRLSDALGIEVGVREVTS